MTTQISARIDDRQMKDFKRICDAMGLTVSSAINIYVKQVIRRNGLPFPMTADNSQEEPEETLEEWQKRNESKLLRRKKELDEGKGIWFIGEEWENLVGDVDDEEDDEC